MTIHTPDESDYGGDWQHEPIHPGTTILTPELLSAWADLETKDKEET